MRERFCCVGIDENAKFLTSVGERRRECKWLGPYKSQDISTGQKHDVRSSGGICRASKVSANRNRLVPLDGKVGVDIVHINQNDPDIWYDVRRGRIAKE